MSGFSCVICSCLDAVSLRILSTLGACEHFRDNSSLHSDPRATQRKPRGKISDWARVEVYAVAPKQSKLGWSVHLHIDSLRLSSSMREFWIALFCIVLSVSGSFIPAAHTMAHAQTPPALEVHLDEDHGHEHDAHGDHASVSDFDQHHHSQGHPGDHGAELHLTAIEMSAFSTERPFLGSELRRFYSDLQQPSPLLPPDPDPDRA